jgi:N6-L-threonylcarbamoyladenine synthase
MNRQVTILAIETSCDETAAAVIRGGRTIISNVVASQIDEHRRYGGIVPEVASRQHILTIDAVLREAFTPAAPADGTTSMRSRRRMGPGAGRAR